MNVANSSGICVLLALTTCLVVGCSKTDEPLPTVQVATGPCVVTGHVRLSGRTPEMALLKNEPCCDGAKPIRDDTVMVDAVGGLANAIVYVITASDGINLRGTGAARTPALLDQKNCQYTPHVLAIQIGQTLTLRSSDDTLHNVHYAAAANPPGNCGFSTVGQERTVAFTQAEFIKLRCDVHPWMAAYVGVFTHPFFAVTAADGSFSIANLPPGTYRLGIWHEKYGTQETSVTVTPTATTSPLELHFESGLK